MTIRTCMPMTILCLVLAARPAAADMTVAVVDMTALIKAHPRTEENRDILRQQLQGFEAEQKTMMDEFASVRDKFIEARNAARDPVLGKAAREDLEAKADGLRDDLQRMEQELSETMLDRRRELEEQKLRMHRLVEDAVRKTVGEVAADRGIDLVLDASAVSISGSGVVAYVGDALDITGAVSRRMTGARDD